MWDSFELNKIAGGIIAGILMLFLIDAIGGALIHPKTPDEAAYTPDGIEEFELAADGGAAPAKPAEPEVNALDLLAAADPAKGEKVFKKCAACHNVEPGGNNGTGPALYGIVGAPKAAKGDFSYSDALASLGGTWTFEDLDHFLANPKGFAKGTKMSFAGLKKPGDRADILAYLNQNGASPLPLPAPSAPAGAPVEEAHEAIEEAVEAVEGAAEEAAPAMEETTPEAAAEEAAHH